MYPYKKQKIGLFGGSFNPPHKAHIKLSNYVVKQLKLNLLIFIPAYKSVDKDGLKYLESRERRHMLDISRAKKKTVISDFEINLKKPVQSIETVRYFMSRFCNVEFFFIFGDDHLSTLHTWEKVEELFKLTNLVVFRRLRENPKICFSNELFSQLHFLNNEIYTHSSSIFRKNLDFNLLHTNVAKYIRSKGLFI